MVEQVADYSPGWGGWRGQDDEVLAALFLLPQATSAQRMSREPKSGKKVKR